MKVVASFQLSSSDELALPCLSASGKFLALFYPLSILTPMPIDNLPPSIRFGPIYPSSKPRYVRIGTPETQAYESLAILDVNP
jgi:hypothetical protein